MPCNDLMPFESSDVGQLIETIWTVVLDCEVQAVSIPAGFADATDILTGMVEITGAWEGVAMLECPIGLIRQAASLMFEIEPDLVSLDQLDDTLCELTNIVGGNFKALLPPSSHLGLPAVAKDTNDPRIVPHTRALTRLAFETSGFVFVVTILSSVAATEHSEQRLQMAAPKA